MLDFLTFQTFITPTLLLIFYYLGALLIPILGWYFTIWIKKTYFTKLSQTIKSGTNAKQRIILLMVFFMTLLGMEIFWRVMFEFFIAYFDMHHALMEINSIK